MFRLSDYRKTGMPTLAEVSTAEDAWKVAEILGIRDHACVEPVVGDYNGFGSARDAIVEIDRGAFSLALRDAA
jgi:hypothetical protein